MEFTVENIVEVFNAVGFPSIEAAVQSLSLSNAFFEAGFNDPTLLVPVLKRFKLINEKLALQTTAAVLLTDQQTKVRQLVDETNPPIGEINNQIASIDEQLALLQG